MWPWRKRCASTHFFQGEGTWTSRRGVIPFSVSKRLRCRLRAGHTLPHSSPVGSTDVAWLAYEVEWSDQPEQEAEAR